MFHTHLLYTLDLFGTIVFASSGALIAREQKRSWVVALFYALLTAVGGGTMRDILLEKSSIFWLRNPGYIGLAATVGLLTFLLAGMTPLRREQFWLADIVSLAIFTVIGAQVAVESSIFGPTTSSYWLMPPLMGLLTSVGGGIVRDLSGARIPYVVQDPCYSLSSLAGGSVYMMLIGVQVASSLAIGGTIVTILGLHILRSHRQIVTI
ncbi:MAG: hypothetical protein F6K11_11185 [Leptolyngbya sp. SIO3F4]|nr:hypothetical protein [Leptolyngbya sp. SIO3F4]